MTAITFISKAVEASQAHPHLAPKASIQHHGEKPPGASIYETGEYLANNPDWHCSDAPHKARWIVEILERNRLDLRHIVEIGSGAGEVLSQLALHFPAAQLEGWDISSQAHAIAQPKSRPGLKFHLGQWTPHPASLTMAIDVFEHIPDYMGFLRQMKGAPGRKLFHIPLDLSVQALLRVKGLMHARSMTGHLHYFCKDTALATLKDCGFEVLDWRYTYGSDLPNRKLRTRVLNVPRHAARAFNEDLAVRIFGGASMLVLAD